MSHEVIYDYVETIDPNLTCAICQSALVDPVTTTSCKHTFCRDCITRAIGMNPQCPIDRSALNISSLRDTEQLVKLMLDELKVKCAAEECGMVMQRGLLLAHLRSCPKAIITCQDGDCGLSMARLRLPHHRAYECFQRKMECNKCGTFLIFKDRMAQIKSDCCEETTSSCELCGETLGKDKNLHQWSCPQVRVACPRTSRGCPSIVSRNELQNHLDKCPFEALSGFFEQNDARFRLLEQRNETLQAEVDLLKVELGNIRSNNSSRSNSNVMNYDNQWMSIRGNWNNGRPIYNQSQPTLIIPNQNQNQNQNLNTTENSPSTPIAPIHNLRPPTTNDGSDIIPRLTIPTNQSSLSPNSSPITPNVRSSLQNDDISYPGITARAAADLAHHRSIVAPSFGSHQSYADWAFNRLSSNNMLSIEDAIHALRASVLQLAGGMDTMERRNEVRTMTESLRVLEEVGSLRAIVTTMRMQVMMSQPTRPSSSSLPQSTLYSSPTFGVSSTIPTSTSISIPIQETTTTSHSQSSLTPNPNSESQNKNIGEPVSEDTYLDPERPHSIRESHAFSTMNNENNDAASSRSSLITAYNAPGTRAGIGRTIGSGAGLNGRTMAIPPPATGEIDEGNVNRNIGGSKDPIGNGNERTGRLSRANPVHLMRQMSNLKHRTRS